jgi:hydroxylaminobenzene mutase
MENINIQKQGNNLIFLGLLLFILGLTIGLFVQNMANPRMGLSAHLEGVLNGVFLMVVGVIWQKISLSPKWLTASYWLLIYSTFANVLAVLIAAITGAGKMMPLAGGQEGSAGLEAIINFLLISLSLTILFACILLLIGFYRFKQVRT